jgi:hypothetical protein
MVGAAPVYVKGKIAGIIITAFQSIIIILINEKRFTAGCQCIRGRNLVASSFDLTDYQKRDMIYAINDSDWN